MTDKEIEKAAEEYFEEYYKYDDAIYKKDVIGIFIAGAEYVLSKINKPEKDNTFYRELEDIDCVIQGNTTRAYPRKHLKNWMSND